MLPEELLSICSPFQEIYCKGTCFHPVKTGLQLSALYYLDMEGNYFYSACTVLSIILSLAHGIQIPHHCLGVKHNILLWGDNISIVI